MSKVVFDISMSLDGFVTAANQQPGNPMGDDGLRLVQWAFGDDERDRAVLTGGVGSLGAVICGRRTYDHSLPWWGANGPSGDARAPVFVVSHSVPDDTPEGGVYTFVTDGIEATLEQARATAGEKVITVMGGAETGRQFIAAGLVDEISLHIAPVLFGAGTRLFENLGDEHIALEPLSVLQSPNATHLKLRVER